MDKNIFKNLKILDGGMGQELLARGMKPNGTLWSAGALLREDNHSLVENVHEDFVKAGADVIITNTFTTRRIRLRENNIEDKFETLNKFAGEIAKRVKNKYPKILVAGGLPPQNATYLADTRNESEILNNFNDQAKILNPFVDFFYFDVLSSVKEICIAINSIKEFNKPFLIGAHISEGTSLPSGEKISDIMKNIDRQNLLGLILACVSPENFQGNIEDIKKINCPFGFKLNAFERTKTTGGYTSNFKKSRSGNPNEFLGQRKDLTPKKMAEFAKKFKNAGATILGGCCETRPSHIKEISKLIY